MLSALSRNDRTRQAEGIIQVGLWVNAVLMAGKLLVGHLGRSEALFADGLESACDLAISAASLAMLRFSSQPFDRRHPYGHGRAENLGAFLVGIVIVITGIWILFTSISAVAAGVSARPHWMTVLAAALTITIKEGLARRTFRAANRLRSPVVSALAHDHRKDALTSIGTLMGCGAAVLGWPVFDPVFAGLTGLLIAHIGIELVRNATHDLIDAALPEAQLQAISSVAEAVDGVEHVHEIRGRRSGQSIIVDLKLDMDPDMTVKRSHEIATIVKQRIFAADASVGDVMIHINPHDDPNHADLIRL
jgi:cation diffusion facilitator family transporter